MKRNSLSTSLKGYNNTCSTPVTTLNPTIRESSYANCHNKNQVPKELWDCNSHSNSNGSEDYMNGFPWPPRSYTCSFCRKEFKSAQALGGHMNVHRRDRARLRQSSPPTDQDEGGPILNLNLNPTTSPTCSTPSLSLLLPSSSSSSSSSSSPSSYATTLKPATCTLPLFVSPTPPSSSALPSELNRWVVVDGIVLNPFSTKNPESTITKSKIAAESLSGIGAREDGCRMLNKAEILRMDLEIGLPRDYDLDLELRLGTYS